MKVRYTNDPQDVFDQHFTVKCPHCRTISNLTAVAIPRYELLQRFKPKNVGIAYRCDSCNEPVFLTVPVTALPAPNGEIILGHSFVEIERPQEAFDLQYLPDDVSAGFSEALLCYSASCFNAFAAMCRRTIQSASMELGTEGSTKVHNQLKDLKSMGVIDEETFTQLYEIILAGHDGAHPHLPKLSPERANILLELMRDVLYQLFVRQAKIKESVELRQQAIIGKPEEKA